MEERVGLTISFWDVLECIHCWNSTTQDFIYWEHAFTVTILRHNVPGFIHCKCGELSLFRVYSHYDSVIELILVKLHSNPLGSKMDAIIISLFQFHLNPLSFMMDANIIYVWVWVTLWCRYLSERACRILLSCIRHQDERNVQNAFDNAWYWYLIQHSLNS